MMRVGLLGLAISVFCFRPASASEAVLSANSAVTSMTVASAATLARLQENTGALGAVRADSSELPRSRWVDSASDPNAPVASAAGSADSPPTWPRPTLVLLKSMAVPGWGQITNRRYLKAAVAIGLETWFIAGAVTEWRRANDARDAFRADPQNLNHYYDYQFYSGNKNDYLWALGVTVFISMFDAYVDAHLRPYQHERVPDVNPPPGVAVVVASF